MSFLIGFSIPIRSFNLLNLLAIVLGFYSSISFAEPRPTIKNDSIASVSNNYNNKFNVSITNVSTKDDRVTVRVRVKNSQNLPVLDLFPENFTVIVDNQQIKFNYNDWKNPKESNPTQAFIVVLVDMSGSMKRLDASGRTRIKSVISALKLFSEELSRINSGISLNQRTQVAIIPFGEAGKFCKGFQVNSSTLDRFIPAGDFKLTNYIDYLSSLDPCASTDIYSPVKMTFEFLSDKIEDNSNHKFGIILLSDGYHNKPNEKEDFQKLLNLIKSNPKITLHTLGYGLTPEQLGLKYKLKRPATRKDIKPLGKVPEEDFVDKDRLAELARVSGGISEFSADAETVSQKLILFITSLLGEYEISYDQPNSERGKKSQVVVAVKEQESNEQFLSEAIPYTVTLFGRSVSRKLRLYILLSALMLFTFGGVFPYYFWHTSLKRLNI